MRRTPTKARLLGVASGLLLVACGAPDATDAPDPGGTARSTSVTGSVQEGPTCAVEPADAPCPPTPVEGALVQLVSRGHVLAATHSTADGSFRLAAEPGAFTIRATATGGLPGNASRPVTLTEGSTVPVRLLLDTGIRRPTLP